jgi:hypothetical protein
MVTIWAERFCRRDNVCKIFLASVAYVTLEEPTDARKYVSRYIGILRRIDC